MEPGQPIDQSELFLGLQREVLDSGVWASYSSIHHDIPPQLFHYTDAGGIKGILETCELWAMHSSCLNDSSEIRHGGELAIESLNDALAESTVATKSIIELAIRSIESSLDPWPPNHFLQAFVACLSEDGDMLNQWRSYAANGDGYSIGFESSGLSAAIKRDIPNSSSRACIYRVEYDLPVQKSLIQNIVRRILQNFAASPKRCDPRVAASLICERIGWLQVFFKNPAFREEREWRIVVSITGGAFQRPEIRSRIKNQSIVPFLAIPIGDESRRMPLSRILCGPKNRSQFTGQLEKSSDLGLFWLLERLGYDPILDLLGRSAIPYR
jgi:hypothetical protein